MLENPTLKVHSFKRRTKSFDINIENMIKSGSNNEHLMRVRNNSWDSSENNAEKQEYSITSRVKKLLILQRCFENEKSEQRSSPEIDKKKTFNFSKRNFYPRQNNFFIKEDKKKISPFDYFSNNYLPTQISPRKNLITMENYHFHKKEDKKQLIPNDKIVSSSFSRDYGKKLLKKEDYLNSVKEDSSTKSTSPNFSIDNNYQPQLGFREKPMISKRTTGINVENKNENFGKKSQFVERQGDWICMRCKNLNFSFRVMCNRCKIPKCESELLYEEHLHNLMNYVRFNDIIQNNLILNPPPRFNEDHFSHQNMLPFNNLYNPLFIPCHQTPFQEK